MNHEEQFRRLSIIHDALAASDNFAAILLEKHESIAHTAPPDVIDEYLCTAGDVMVKLTFTVRELISTMLDVNDILTDSGSNRPAQP